MPSPVLNLILAEILFLALVMVVINTTKKPKERKSHKESLVIFSANNLEFKGTFEENRERYIQAVKEGRYKTKDLACRDLYDLDEEYYRCLEEVYFN